MLGQIEERHASGGSGSKDERSEEKRAVPFGVNPKDGPTGRFLDCYWRPRAAASLGAVIVFGSAPQRSAKAKERGKKTALSRKEGRHKQRSENTIRHVAWPARDEQARTSGATDPSHPRSHSFARVSSRKQAPTLGGSGAGAGAADSDAARSWRRDLTGEGCNCCRGRVGRLRRDGRGEGSAAVRSLASAETRDVRVPCHALTCLHTCFVSQWPPSLPRAWLQGLAFAPSPRAGPAWLPWQP